MHLGIFNKVAYIAYNVIVTLFLNCGPMIFVLKTMTFVNKLFVCTGVKPRKHLKNLLEFIKNIIFYLKNFKIPEFYKRFLKIYFL